MRFLSSHFCRLLFATAVTSGLVLFGAGRASAHVEAEAGARADDGPVTITVTAEADADGGGEPVHRPAGRPRG
ncbi:MAG: hypothetical protein JWP40_3037 [Blastococcus sp.]|nr:hypothetical protein [Blastococcus sp.]